MMKRLLEVLRYSFIQHICTQFCLCGMFAKKNCLLPPLMMYSNLKNVPLLSLSEYQRDLERHLRITQLQREQKQSRLENSTRILVQSILAVRELNDSSHLFLNIIRLPLVLRAHTKPTIISLFMRQHVIGNFRKDPRSCNWFPY